MVQLIAVGMFGLSVIAAISESIIEKDWPRDTFRFVLMSAACVIAAGIF